MLPNKNQINWIILFLSSAIGLGISLFAFNEILNIPPPTTLEVKSPYPKNIIILSPRPGQVISNPAIVSGKAKIAESDLMVRIKDFEGNTLREQKINNMTNELLPFQAAVNYEKPNGGSGLVEVFEYSADIDSYICKKAVPITFTK